MMSLFSLLESFFFLFLGLTFVLILLMVYHFKKRLDVLEKTNESLGDVCKSIVEEMEGLKHMVRSTSYGTTTFASEHIVNACRSFCRSRENTIVCQTSENETKNFETDKTR